ncbi:Rhodanese-like domain-containing protein [Artemisia annua]|uniref:Rhodanese-like domain-containing protein n=1 Tax=Artemisia annua TaxID=35608 RepID=A0A2U1Q2M6_ARTAN|nr:Rhodanese-like domain-containing protein [Artemisia annua]
MVGTKANSLNKPLPLVPSLLCFLLNDLLDSPTELQLKLVRLADPQHNALRLFCFSDNKLPFNNTSLKLSPDHFIIASTNNTKPDLYAEFLSKTDTTNDDDVFAAINDSLSALVCNIDTAISNALNTFQLSSKGLNDTIDGSLNKLKVSFNSTLSGFGNNSKGVSSKAGAIAVDGLRQSIVAVEQILAQGGTLVVYVYSSLKDMLPPELHDLLDSTEQTLRPVGTTLRQAYMVLEGFETNLGIDPADPIVPFLLLIGTSTTLWYTFLFVFFNLNDVCWFWKLTHLHRVSYWILTYAGYAGDLSPKLTFELLNNKKERVALIDDFRERDGIPDLRRTARFRYASVAYPEIDGNVKKLLKSGKDLDDALVATVIRNLKVVQDMLPSELHDLLDSTEQTLRPVGTTLRQVYIVLEGFETNLGIDPTDPIVPFLLLLGTSTTLWVSYWILTYAGYAGDLSPKLTFELLNNKKERVALIDDFRERDGIPDLRRTARFRYASVAYPEIDGNVKKLLKSGKDLDDALVATVIRNLKVVQGGSKVIVMDADGSRSKAIARSLRKVGIKASISRIVIVLTLLHTFHNAPLFIDGMRPYLVQGGFRSWVQEGLRVKEPKPETTFTILNELYIKLSTSYTSNPQVDKATGSADVEKATGSADVENVEKDADEKKLSKRKRGDSSGTGKDVIIPDDVGKNKLKGKAPMKVKKDDTPEGDIPDDVMKQLLKQMLKNASVQEFVKEEYEENHVMSKVKGKKKEKKLTADDIQHQEYLSKLPILQARTAPTALHTAIHGIKHINLENFLADIGFSSFFKFDIDYIPSRLGRYVVKNFDERSCRLNLVGCIGGVPLLSLETRPDGDGFEAVWKRQFDKNDKKVRVNDIALKLIASKEVDFLFKINFLTLFINTMGMCAGLQGEINLDVVRRLLYLDSKKYKKLPVVWTRPTIKQWSSFLMAQRQDMELKEECIGELDLYDESELPEMEGFVAGGSSYSSFKELLYLDSTKYKKLPVVRTRPAIKQWSSFLMAQRQDMELKEECIGELDLYDESELPETEGFVAGGSSDSSFKEDLLKNLKEKLAVISNERASFEELLSTAGLEFPGDLDVIELHKEYVQIFKHPVTLNGEDLDRDDNGNDKRLSGTDP